MSGKYNEILEFFEKFEYFNETYTFSSSDSAVTKILEKIPKSTQ